MQTPDSGAGEAPVADIFGVQAAALQREAREFWEQQAATSIEAVRKDESNEESRLAAAYWLGKLNRHEEAIAVLAEGVRRDCSAGLRHRYIDQLARCNRTEQAIAVARESARAFPDDVLSRMKEALLLPVLYRSTDEIDQYRKRFAEGLSRLAGEIRLDTEDRRREAVGALGRHVNVLLGYQGRDDRDLQIQYGELASRIMRAAYPRWSRQLPMPVAVPREPLRIGFVSGRFRDLSATRFFMGWMQGLDRGRFSVHAWHTGTKTDKVTDEVRRICKSFHHFAESQPSALEKTCNSIRDHDLHALVYLDIGLEPLVTQMAALRLAPLQCMAWDQPITSGLPAIDCAFSADLSEPEGGATHYSERLIRLPGIGVCYRKPLIPGPLLQKTRRDFGLRDESIVYLCCQSVYKFLPQNDWVYAQIARGVANAQFVFLVTNEFVGADLRTRLDNAFSLAGMRADNYCVMLPELKHLDYWNLHLVADIFLDTIGWSSGGSVLEAIACGLPVVTLPGNLMRSRQGYAALTQLDVPDTVAHDRSKYVEIAVRLATDWPFRRKITQRMKKGFPQLYSDKRSIAALEEFFMRETEL
jgi:protein O-GlcNAc transferase